MLRQALDAAEGQKQQEATAAAAANETTSLASATPVAPQLPCPLSDSGRSRGYGTTGTASEDGDSMGQSDDATDEDYLLDDDSQDDSDPQPGLLLAVWERVKSAFFIVANVENLWDTPPDPRQSQQAARSEQNRRVNFVVFFWFFVLAVSYASERATYKILVDRSGPFRLFAGCMVTAVHAIMLGLVMIVSYLTNQMQPHPLGIPIVDVGLMALLDTASLLLVFLTGYHVPPTLTVILVQFTLPLTAFLTQFVHPDGRCACRRREIEATGVTAPSRTSISSMGQQNPSSEHLLQHNSVNSQTSDSTNNSNGYERGDESITARSAGGTSTSVVEGTPLPGFGGLSAEHVWGSLIIFLAVLLALLPAFYSIANPSFFIYADTIPMMTAYNTLLFVSSCIPAAASQLYKEHIFVEYKQPVNAGYLNLLLSIFQFIFASVMSPLVFGLQGLAAEKDWTSLYPSAEFSENFMDGLKCFFGQLDREDQLHKYWDDANCRFSLGLVCFHAFAIIAVGVAVDKIVSAGATKVMYRGISAGIILAVLAMHAYDMSIPYFNYGPIVDGLNLACLLLLILGSEVYHRVSLQESTFETVYAEVQNFYDDDDD
jgi:hypothetical protein